MCSHANREQRAEPSRHILLHWREMSRLLLLPPSSHHPGAHARTVTPHLLRPNPPENHLDGTVHRGSSKDIAAIINVMGGRPRILGLKDRQHVRS